jgi:maleate isomerase
MSYGRDGRLGVATPQSNPTVEAECAILLPRTISLQATRLTSRLEDPAGRLRAYLEGLDATLASYDVLRLDAFGFACTGSSYLLGSAREAAIVEAAQARLGAPVLTAAGAIVRALQQLGARRIGLVAPYPDDLLRAGVAWLEGAGFAIAGVARADIKSTDTRAIYALGANEAASALSRLSSDGLDAVLISGTGMASLSALAAPPKDFPPVISSNSALAAGLLRAIGRGDLLEPNGLMAKGWRLRLAEALGTNDP